MAEGAYIKVAPLFFGTAWIGILYIPARSEGLKGCENLPFETSKPTSCYENSA